MTAAQLAPLERAIPADADVRRDVERLLAGETRRLGFRPISDQAWSELHHGPVYRGLVALVRDHDGALDAAAVATVESAERWTVEVVAGGGEVAVHRMRQLLASIVRGVVGAGGQHLTWLVQAANDDHVRVAAEFGLAVGRGLFQMQRPLPTGLEFSIETRAFDPARDLDEWVRVNARAFAWNPEQGSWTAQHVRARMDEPWFDARGFLVHDRMDAAGSMRMAGFCWTKVHDAVGTQPRLGEIYVIAVDPDFHGLGLGRALTLAGLDHLAGRGITQGMLFVDADNTPAVTLYEKLGFHVERTDRQFTGALRPAATEETT